MALPEGIVNSNKKPLFGLETGMYFHRLEAVTAFNLCSGLPFKEREFKSRACKHSDPFAPGCAQD